MNISIKRIPFFNCFTLSVSSNFSSSISLTSDLIESRVSESLIFNNLVCRLKIKPYLFFPSVIFVF